MPLHRLLKHPGAVVLALVAVLVAASVAAGSSSSGSGGGGSVAFRETAEGTRAFNLPGERRTTLGRVLRGPAESFRVLRELGIERSATKPVNWRRESAIVVLSAYVPTGGYRARVQRVDVHGREAVVTARVRYEGGDFATQALERPWVVVAVKRSALAGVRTDVRVKLR